MNTLACPFCGGWRARFLDTGPCDGHKTACWIECVDCGASGPTAFDGGAAFAKWNERKEAQPVPVPEPPKVRKRGRSFKKV